MINLNLRIASINLTGSGEQVEVMLDSWYHQFTTILDELAPVKQLSCRKQSLPWISLNIKKLMSERDKLAKRIGKDPTHADTDMFEQLKTLRRRIKSQIRSEAKKFGQSALDENDHKRAWSFIKDVTFTHSKESINGPDPNRLNDYFAAAVHQPNDLILATPSGCDPQDSFTLSEISSPDVFRSLKSMKSSSATGPDGLPGHLLKKLAPLVNNNVTKIFNASINQCHFPGAWKKANVCPVYKQKGSKDDPSNYRPISVLPVLARVFEKLVAGQLQAFCDGAKIIPDEQFGFRKNSSCELALLTTVDRWYSAIDTGQLIGALLLDMSRLSTPYLTGYY